MQILLVQPSKLPRSLESLLEAFNLTLPDVCVDIIVCHTNQKYKQYCREHPKGSVACRFRGYKSFSKEEFLAFMASSFISGAHKATKNPISDLYDSKFLKKLHCLVIGCC